MSLKRRWPVTPDNEQLGSWEWNPLTQETRFVLKKTPARARLTFHRLTNSIPPDQSRPSKEQGVPKGGHADCRATTIAPRVLSAYGR